MRWSASLRAAKNKSMPPGLGSMLMARAWAPRRMMSCSSQIMVRLWLTRCRTWTTARHVWLRLARLHSLHIWFCGEAGATGRPRQAGIPGTAAGNSLRRWPHARGTGP